MTTAASDETKGPYVNYFSRHPANVAEGNRQWWHQIEGEAHRSVLETVRRVEAQQWFLFDRFVKLEAFYDPLNNTRERTLEGFVTENVISSNIDTVAAIAGASDIRSRYQTDGADWATQRVARHMEWYSEGLAKLYNRRKACQAAFKSAAKKGTGLVAVYTDRFDRIRVEEVLVDDVIVPLSECRGGQSPRQLHRRSIVDREELKAEWPEKAAEIDKAQQTGSWAKWADYRPLEPNEVVKLESWRLPIGEYGKDGYVPGRHIECVDGATLRDEVWHKTSFPLIRIVWVERSQSWYGISLTEGIAGHQQQINKLNWQTDRLMDQIAVPTTYVDPVDANVVVKSNRAGNFAVIRGREPKTVIPQAQGAEAYARMETLKDSASAFAGVSRLHSQAVKPAGVDSGRALREYTGQVTQRFAQQEQAFEELTLAVDFAILECCRELGDKAPTIARKSRFGSKRVSWKDLAANDIRVMQAAASTLGRTPAGREQLVLELAQAGIISVDQTRRLMGHPDLESELSLYNAALESIEHDFDEIADGNIVMPEPYANLKMCEWRGQQEYLKWAVDGAPEDVLEALRQYIVQAIAIREMQAANANVAGGVAADPMAAANANAPAEMPAGAQPQAALAAQAMQLKSA